MKNLVVIFFLLAVIMIPFQADAKKYYSPENQEGWTLLVYGDDGDFYYSPASIRILGPLIYSVKLKLKMKTSGRILYEVKSMESLIEIDVLQHTYITRNSTILTLGGERIADNPSQDAVRFDPEEDILHAKVANMLIVWFFNSPNRNPAELKRELKAVDERIAREKPELYQKLLKEKREAKSRQ